MKRIATLAASIALLATSALADYPQKLANFIVPWPPGDLEDQLTRMIADAFQETYSSPAAVVNKPGGGGGPFPGAVHVAGEPADGYTIGSFVMEVPIVGPQIGIPELAPSPFEPIGSFLTYPFVVAASKSARFTSIDGLAAYSKDNDVVLAHFGQGLVPTQVTFALAKRSGITFTSDAAFDAIDCNTLASGDADVINSTLQLLLPCLDDLNVLVSFTPDRITLTPDAPALKELQPDLDIELWNGLFVHKDTPAQAREKIAKVAKDTVLGERAQELGKKTGAFIYWQDAGQTAARIKADAAKLEFIDSVANQ